MSASDKVPCGQVPSTPEDVPGKPMTMSSTILDKGAQMIQSLEPIHEIKQHVCTFAFYSHAMGRQIETHHFASRVNEDFLQCLVYDSDQSNGRLVGVEYIVSERLFEGLSDEEKKLWHSHSFEIKAGLCVHPGLPESVQKQELKSLAKTYGKFWCTWQFDRGDRLPLGPPALMMSPQHDCPVSPQLVNIRDKKYGIDTEEKRQGRLDIEGLSAVDPLADYWRSLGKGWAVQLKEVDMVLPGPVPLAKLVIV